VKRWDKEGVVEYMGETDDVREHIANSSCVVLPSYREGLPRTLLEAASMGRPIIATDVTGCREVVKNGVNGYLCRVRNATDLTIKIKNFLRLSVDERRSMGLEGRAIVEEEFNEKILIEKIVSQIEKLLSVHA
jgi:glycosyltransferase involved in cell wall biosynthesis